MKILESTNMKFPFNWKSDHKHFKIYHSFYVLFTFLFGTFFFCLLLPTNDFVLSKSIHIGSATQGDNVMHAHMRFEFFSALF